MLRKLIKSLSSSKTENSNGTPQIDLVTIGGGGRASGSNKFRLSRHPYEANITVLATVTRLEDDVDGKERDCERDSAMDGDDESTRKMIRVTRRIERTVLIVGQEG